MIWLELPASVLSAPSGVFAPLIRQSDTAERPSASERADGEKRRVRFSKAEEDLLVWLREQRDPKLSWKDIQCYFPNRTTGSLQVHFSTQLKGRCGPKAARSKLLKSRREAWGVLI